MVYCVESDACGAYNVSVVVEFCAGSSQLHDHIHVCTTVPASVTVTVLLQTGRHCRCRLTVRSDVSCDVTLTY